MAVQKSKKSRSRRGMRRAHNQLDAPTLAHDPKTGELHLRHHVTSTGFYRGQFYPRLAKLLTRSRPEQENAEAEE